MDQISAVSIVSISLSIVSATAIQRSISISMRESSLFRCYRPTEIVALRWISMLQEPGETFAPLMGGHQTPIQQKGLRLLRTNELILVDFSSQHVPNHQHQQFRCDSSQRDLSADFILLAYLIYSLATPIYFHLNQRDRFQVFFIFTGIAFAIWIEYVERGERALPLVLSSVPLYISTSMLLSRITHGLLQVLRRPATSTVTSDWRIEEECIGQELAKEPFEDSTSVPNAVSPEKMADE